MEVVAVSLSKRPVGRWLGTGHPHSRGGDAGGVDAEYFGEAGAALVGEVDRAAALGPADPAEVEQVAGQGGADAAGEVGPLLAPVDAVAHGRAPRWQRGEVDAELLQEGGAGLCEPEADRPA